MYQHRMESTQGGLRVVALVGTRAVELGFDVDYDAAQRRSLLGFAVQKTRLPNGPPEWLRGMKRFADQARPQGDARLPTNEAPVQRFHWGDYALTPGQLYRYTVHPMWLRGGARVLDTQGTTVELETAAEDDGAVGIYFNRGVTAAPAYLRRFGQLPPEDLEDPAEAKSWLSRGLLEALLRLIDAAVRGDGLRVAIYEFEHDEVLAALKRASVRGVDVRVVYHDRGDETAAENRRRARALRLGAGKVRGRGAVPKLLHDKFVVHLEGTAPKRVWTGSTNFTDNAFYLQTNVGLLLHDPVIADIYARCFDLLWQDLPTTAMKDAIGALSARPTPPGSAIYLSPTRSFTLLDDLVGMIEAAEKTLLVSCPFGLDARLSAAMIDNRDRVLEYALVNTSMRNKLRAQLPATAQTRIVAPARVARYDDVLWDPKKEPRGHRVHVKCVIQDPWGDSGRVYLGSANMSDESITKNDENGVILDDSRVAAVAATEFLRMFDHYRFREAVKADPADEFLAASGDWNKPFFVKNSARQRELAAFAGR